ncbi:MAG: hypothetical protein ABH811_01865, partial [archaeon]
MKKSLLAGLLLGATALGVGAETLYEKVKDYLGEHGLPRLEYFLFHNIMVHQGDPHYQQVYSIDGKPFLARFYPYPPQEADSETTIVDLDNGADVYFFDGKWYRDESCDGINGNEVLAED